jgi:hypothetical protein
LVAGEQGEGCKAEEEKGTIRKREDQQEELTVVAEGRSWKLVMGGEPCWC